MLLNRSFFLFVLIIGAVLAQVDGTPWWWSDRPAECTGTSGCAKGSFCNFDRVTSGFCENCSHLWGTPCKYAGLNQKEGVADCQAKCEGTSTTTAATTTAKTTTTTATATTAKTTTTTAAGTTTTKTSVTTATPGTSCTSKITFPIKALKGISGYPWMMEVFGIPLIATDKFKKSGKLNHVASILAELLDQDQDGCADDANVLKNILTKQDGTLRKAVVLPNKEDDATQTLFNALKAKGFLLGQIEAENETKPKCSGLNFTNTCSDASIEELLHFVNSFGHVAAYPKIFGSSWNSKSTMTKGMDIARGKRMKNTPSTLSGYPKNAWYRYTDTTCTYKCQAIEYIWWSYCSYSGVCAGRVGNKNFENEFKLLKKADLIKKDKIVTKLFQDSEKKTASYRFPTKPVDGIYTGCKKCNQTGGKSHGGS